MDTDHVTEQPDGLRLQGRYMLGRPISTGGMGAVYSGTDEQTGRPVAVKRLLERRHATRFAIEARLLAQLRHPRVVRVLDHFEDESGMYLVMELVSGVDLATLLRERGAPGIAPDEAVDYARQACEALQYVHDQQMIHRDVKPANLILGDDGVTLVDFGIAREFGSEDDATVGVGTPRFMAPEVFAGGAVSPRTDVFGVAATLWTLLAGEPPVYGDRMPLAERVAGLLPEIEQTIRAGLEIVPERRISSVAAFATALGSPLESTAGTSLALSAAGSPASRRMMEAVVRTAAGVFEAASVSIALSDEATGELVYQAAWGAGASEIVGVRLRQGEGLAGSVVSSGQAMVVPECRTDPRFAERVARGTGYIPNTMLVAPLSRDERVVGALSVLDRRDSGAYGLDDVERATLFADLAVETLDLDSASAD